MIQHKAKKWGVERVAEERDLLEEFLVTIERMAKNDIAVLYNVNRVCNRWRKERDSIKKI
jgi:hypothetical protein